MRGPKRALSYGPPTQWLLISGCRCDLAKAMKPKARWYGLASAGVGTFAAEASGAGLSRIRAVEASSVAFNRKPRHWCQFSGLRAGKQSRAGAMASPKCFQVRGFNNAPGRESTQAM